MNTTEIITKTIVPSANPQYHLDMMAYPGQPKANYQYRTGYEKFLKLMPVLDKDDPILETKVAITERYMESLATTLATERWIKDTVLPSNTFKRTIVGVEEPTIGCMAGVQGILNEKTELIVAQWGTGFSSPVHGHSDGYIYENIINGKILVNTYRLHNPITKTVRLVKSEIVSKGLFASIYAKPSEEKYFTRQNLIHNFTALEPTTTLHYLPEHTRDGRDNSFDVQHFDQYNLLRPEMVTRITAKQGMYSQIGDVILVRSTNVPEYGDHYIVVTGAPVAKEHGVRPQDIAIVAPNTSSFLDKYEPKMGLTLLKLNDLAKEAFYRFHGIVVKDGIVAFAS